MANQTNRLTLVGLVILCFCPLVSSVYLLGTETSYAQFSLWNICLNSSLSFSFKTSQQSALLMYTDDNGVMDFFQINLEEGIISLTIKISNQPDVSQTVKIVGPFHDNQWHSVTVKRNSEITSFTVDQTTEHMRFEGTDFLFGSEKIHNYVYFGGMQELDNSKVSNPEAKYSKRFKGFVRNVIYGNCSCIPVRAEVVGGIDMDDGDDETCKKPSICDKGCICIRTDNGYGCDCVYRETCLEVQQPAKYYLPMDVFSKGQLDPNSGLDATVSGYPIFGQGVKNKALYIQNNQHIRINGLTHRFDCVMDLDLCPAGYTISMWMSFRNPTYKRQLFMSSGAHLENSHGIAMYYRKGVLEFVFRNKAGLEWTEKSMNILPYHWYHVTATWSKLQGLKLYVNGINTHSKSQPPKQKKAADSSPNSQPRHFYIGCSDTQCAKFGQGIIIVDEFRFWPKYVSTKRELRQLGAIFHYYLNMDKQHRNELDVKYLDAKLHDNAMLSLDSKLGKALHLGGKGDYVSLKHKRGTCLKDTSKCMYGFMISTWIKFKNLSGKHYYMSSGPKGFTIYSVDNELFAKVINNNQLWKVWTGNIKTGEWYFLEISFHMKSGLSMYLNQRLVGSPTVSSHKIIGSIQQDEIYIGQNMEAMSSTMFPEVAIDEMDIYLADRDTLIFIDFIQRGRPNIYYFPFERMVGQRISHPSIRIQSYGNPHLVTRKIGKAIQLNGRSQYIDVNEHPRMCLGNLDLCPHGFLMSMWLRLNKTLNNMDYFSTALNGLSFKYINGKFKFSLSTSSRKWTAIVDSKEIPEGEWRFIEISWHPTTGLVIYNNNRLIALDNSHGVNAVKKTNYKYNTYEDRFYLGKGKDLVGNTVFGAVTFDDIKYWFGDRNYLLMHGYIKRGRPTNYLIDMDKIDGNVLTHDKLYIMAEGNPHQIPGRIGYALNFNESGQYLNFGRLDDVCFGNLDKCTHGFLLSSWMKFGNYHNNMHYFASGDGGISMYQDNGYLHVIFINSKKKWKIQVPNPEMDTWHFVELSWHPDTGLKMYINNELVGYSEGVNFDRSLTGNKEFYIGAPSTGYGANPNFAIDEMEIWYGNRDNLVAFDYINRDGSRPEPFSMESEKNHIVENSHFIINLVNGANVVEGKLGNGVTMNGKGQYVRINGNMKDCIYNLNHCKTGLTLGLWLKPFDLNGKKYYISSPAYSLYSKDNILYAKFQNATHSWEMSTPKFKGNVWQQVVMSWDPARGSKLYINHEKVAQTTTSKPFMQGDTPAEGIYIGTSGNNVGRFTPDFDVDEVQYYRTSVNGILDGFGPFYVATESPEIVFRFDRLLLPRVNMVGYPDLVSSDEGNVIRLNGRDQYIDLGNDITCGGDLENCVDGHVMRLYVKADKLIDNTYFLDSYPTSVYYKDGQLHAEMRTATQTWHVNTTEFEAGTWQYIELDWYPDVGLRLFLNRREVAHDTIPYLHQKRPTSSKTYIGRSLKDSLNSYYFNGFVKQMELWRRNRNYHKPKPEQTITLSGNSYYGFNISIRNNTHHVSPNKEQFKLKFKNDLSQREGLLWYALDSSRKIFLYIKDGDLFLIIIGVDGQKYRWKMKKPSNVTFNDGKMHNVLLRRDGHEVYWSVDDIYRQAFSLPISISLLRPKDYIFIGGTPDNIDYTSSEVDKNFKGITGNLIYTSGRYVLDILNMNPQIIHGVHPPTTHTPIDITPSQKPPNTFSPITFVRHQSYVETDAWDISQGGQLKFKFYTNDPEGLMFYNGDPRYYAAVEISEGKLYFVYNFGDGSKRISFFDDIVNDRQAHEATVTINPLKTFLKLELDNKKKSVRLQLNERQNRPLPGPMYVGWVPNANRLPWDLWAKKGYQGCLLNVQMNHIRTNLLSNVGRFQLGRAIDARCYPIVPQCDSTTCKNGNCIDYWNGYSCDCTNEPFTGPNCGQAAPVTMFDGTKGAWVIFADAIRSHTNDISLRFKTHLSNTTLFHTTAENSTDSAMAVLENGILKLIITVNGQRKVLRAGSDLNDQKWHTMQLKRKGNQLYLKVDNGKASEGHVDGKGFYFIMKRLDIASAKGGSPDGSYFVGFLQNLFYNGHDVFSMEQREPRTTLVFVNNTNRLPSIVYNPITISNIKSFVRLPKLNSLGNIIELMFKTKESSGILLFNNGMNNEFIALEIFKRNLWLVYDTGKNPTSIHLNSLDVSDDKWHSVKINFVTPQQIIAHVDGSEVIYNQQASDKLDLDGPLYLGGIPKSLLKGKIAEQLSSTHGFKGCLASIHLNDKPVGMGNLAGKGSSIKSGCLAISTICQKTTCANNGRCHQGPTGYLCDCDKTGYTGTRCTEQPLGYYIGKNKLHGVIVYTYPPDKRIDSSEEELALGFMTQHTNGVLTRIVSSVNDDFIEIRMVDGKIQAIYDTAGSKHILSSIGNYSDGQYHTLYFTRNFTDSVLLIDNNESITSENEDTYPAGYFDKLTTITVGAAEKISASEYKEPFYGIIGGYNFNNLFLFNNRRKLTISGDAVIADIPYSLSGRTGSATEEMS
ncbi:uncharacterized protein LOC106882798 isoform X1 [Octopus bimaculoides]|uniref:uncharacterized protein LOC106882798 isoform X1 n=1 Tax=Octopus bimaculoides TaxID=37653 RepID=UPI0022E8CBEC|nr:uncharacterized protein LOC106882798 isoform X1 [Octopus bimaculoides]XP_052825989.1 uncharacterized protein LOC106882798 isoform X1 [Octopus bimaculoides]